MSGFKDFLKREAADNSAGLLGKGFIAFDIGNLIAGKNKLEAIKSLFINLILLRPVMAAGFAGLFLAMGKGIRSLVHDIGSLDAALKKLRQIQGLEKTFAGLMGGASAARKKVAELVNFSASKNVKIGDVGESARSLEIFTRGAYSSSEALAKIADAAAATGNAMPAVSDAVGQFYAALREGAPINGMAEGLRQMGLITQSTADHLVDLQSSGAPLNQVFEALTSSLGRFAGGAATATGELDGVNAAYERAEEALQEKFGSPFVESDIQNTQNWTTAMNAVAPVVERVSKVFAILFNGLSTTKSELVAWVSSSKTLMSVIEGLVYAFTGLVTVVSGLASVSLASWMVTLGRTLVASEMQILVAGEALSKLTLGLMSAERGAKVAAVAMRLFRAASMLTGFGVFAAIGVTAIGIFQQYQKRVEEADNKVREAYQSALAINAALREQVAAATNAEQANTALVASLNALVDAQNALNAARAKGQGNVSEAELGALESVLRKRQRLIKEAETKAASPKLGFSEEKKQAARDTFRRSEMLENQRRQNEIAAASGPAQRAQRIKAGLDIDTHRKQQGALGNQARLQLIQQQAEARLAVAKVETDLKDKKAQIDSPLTVKKAITLIDPDTGFESTNEVEVPKLDKKEREAEAKKAEAALKVAKQRERALGNDAPIGSSVRFEAKARDADAKGNYRLRDVYQLNAGAARDKEEKQRSGDYAQQIAAATAELAELAKVTGRTGFDATKDSEYQRAELKRDGGAMRRIDDLRYFEQEQDKLRAAGRSDEQAKAEATMRTNSSIALDARSQAANTQVAATELARIGGGGNVSALGGADPMLEASRRQIALQQEIANYTQRMAEAANGGMKLTQ